MGLRGSAAALLLLSTPAWRVALSAEIAGDEVCPAAGCATGAAAAAGEEESSLLQVHRVDDDADIKGYYAWEWSPAWKGPEGTNLGICFNGYSKVATALGKCTKTLKDLNAKQWISIGGNGKNGHGIITPAALDATGAAAKTIAKDGFVGVMFDVEVVNGATEDLVKAFQTASKNLKAQSLQVGVTTSHSGPTTYEGGAEGPPIVKGWVADPNLDIISPQLYTTGHETQPQHMTTANCAGCTWDLYKSPAKAVIAPSIVKADQYDAAKTFFASQGITTKGYIQWAQIKMPPPANTFCGTSWGDANKECKTPCAGDADCSAPLKCYSDVCKR